LIAGCAVHPVALSLDERKAAMENGEREMFDNQQPVQGPITLEEAMARALKYNLDSRVKLMEAAVEQRQLKLSNFDLLPKLAASAGYSSRDNLLASSSQSVRTGQQSLEPSTSSDYSILNGDLSLSWNILDFGVSYYSAKQQADRVLGVQERRRKVVQLLMQQVREAFWQAAGAQRLQDQIEPLLAQTRQALDDSRKIESSNLAAPLDALGYQRELLELVLQLEGIRDQLLQAKPKLAALMNLEPGKPYELSVPDGFTVPQVDVAPEKMEEMALLHRPELIEAGYNERIGLNETRKALARLLPGVELDIGTHYDSNSFLVNNYWRDAGIKASWNLLNIVNAKNIRAAAKAQYDVAREQRMAASMAVLTQVHVAWIDYSSRKQQFQLVYELSNVEQRILEHTRNAAAADAKGKLAEIRAATGALMSGLRLYQNYSALQGAYGQMLATLGIDPLPDTVANGDLNTLVAALRAPQASAPQVSVSQASASQDTQAPAVEHP
jgi:outer membrane protein TolC